MTRCMRGGARDVSKSNIATHYVRSSRLPALEARLASMEAATVRDVAAAIDEFSADESATCAS